MDSHLPAAAVPIRVEHAVARSLVESEGHADVYPTVLAAVGAALGWQLGAAWENGEAAALRCVEVWTEPGLDSHGFSELSRRTSFVQGEGLPGRVWLTGVPDWIVDVTVDSNFP